jgi:hypothetical protein
MTRQQSLLRKCVRMRNMLLAGHQPRLPVSVDRVRGGYDPRAVMPADSQSPSPESQPVRLFGNWVLGVGN